MAILRIGLPLNVVDINAKAGSLYIELRDTLEKIHNFQAALTAITNADLEAADQNGKAFTSDEVTYLKSAFTDLDKLRGIFQGTDTQAAQYDFRTFGKFLAGGA